MTRLFASVPALFFTSAALAHEGVHLHPHEVNHGLAHAGALGLVALALTFAVLRVVRG